MPRKGAYPHNSNVIVCPTATRTVGSSVSRVETSKATGQVDVVPREVLERVAGELRRHGVRARARPDYRSIPDLYILEDDAELLDKLCDEKRLSKEAEELLC